MDAQEIITFLVFVFWIVMGLLGQKRKAEKRRQRELQTKQERSTDRGQSTENQREMSESVPPFVEEETQVRDILEEILGKKPVTETVQPKPISSSKPSYPPPVSRFEDPAAIAFKEKQIASQMKHDYEMQMHALRQDIAETFRMKNVHRKKTARRGYSRKVAKEFDLRKAVIFSEILKRPYE